MKRHVCVPYAAWASVCRTMPRWWWRRSLFRRTATTCRSSAGAPASLLSVHGQRSWPRPCTAFCKQRQCQWALWTPLCILASNGCVCMLADSGEHAIKRRACAAGVRPVDVEAGGQGYQPQVDESDGGISAVYDAPGSLREGAYWEEQRSQIVGRRAVSCPLLSWHLRCLFRTGNRKKVTRHPAMQG
jgi:hypothetical protein